MCSSDRTIFVDGSCALAGSAASSSGYKERRGPLILQSLLVIGSVISASFPARSSSVVSYLSDRKWRCFCCAIDHHGFTLFADKHQLRFFGVSSFCFVFLLICQSRNESIGKFQVERNWRLFELSCGKLLRFVVESLGIRRWIVQLFAGIRGESVLLFQRLPHCWHLLPGIDPPRRSPWQPPCRPGTHTCITLLQSEYSSFQTGESAELFILSLFPTASDFTFALFFVQKVVYRTRSMHSPTNCYLVSLAAADCVVLIASVPNEILSYYVIGSQWIWGSVGCAIFVFLQNLGIKSLQTSARDPSSRSSGTRPKSMLIRALCLIRRDQRVVAEFDGVHSRALHRHLSPDEGPERLHGQARQEDRRRRLGIRFLLLVALARPHRHRAHPLQGIPDGRALRNEIIPSRVLGIISK